MSELQTVNTITGKCEIDNYNITFKENNERYLSLKNQKILAILFSIILLIFSILHFGMTLFYRHYLSFISVTGFILLIFGTFMMKIALLISTENMIFRELVISIKYINSGFFNRFPRFDIKYKNRNNQIRVKSIVLPNDLTEINKAKSILN